MIPPSNGSISITSSLPAQTIAKILQAGGSDAKADKDEFLGKSEAQIATILKKRAEKEAKTAAIKAKKRGGTTAAAAAAGGKVVITAHSLWCRNVSH
eukprot:15328428-Ditylum_brightwellii.AAC.1